MAKKSMIARDVKRQKMVERFAAKRAALMAAFEAAADPKGSVSSNLTASTNSGYMIVVVAEVWNLVVQVRFLLP